MIGVDIVSIERIERFVARFGDRGLARFLSDQERLIAKKTATIAGFWAAKEACAKALGSGIGGEVGFMDIAITKSPKGAPLLELSQRVKSSFGVQSCSLSIAHDNGMAVAVVAIT